MVGRFRFAQTAGIQRAAARLAQTARCCLFPVPLS
ncbi:MAG: hypothetical protein QOJ39_899 [Candidatus Eremiobacteraeota bacterium]|jgi:hypothetical protein|nr:hypothetical protein [Candidatus Eremiobacteraeota bacterium]